MPRWADPGGELIDDLGGRHERHLDVRHSLERAAIIECAATLREDEARPGKERRGVLLKAPLRGDGQNERGIGHRAFSTIRSSQNEQPTAAIVVLAPRC